MNYSLIVNMVLSVFWVLIPILLFNYLIKHYDIEKKYITKGMLYSVLAFFLQIILTFFMATLGIASGGFMGPFIVLLGSILALYWSQKLKVSGCLSIDKTLNFYPMLGFGAGFGGIFVIINGLMTFIISFVVMQGFELSDIVQQVVNLSVYQYGADLFSIVMILYNLVSIVFNIFFPLALVLFLMRGYYYRNLFSSIAIAVLIESLVTNLIYGASLAGVIIGFIVMVGAIYYIIKKYIPMMHEFFDKIHPTVMKDINEMNNTIDNGE